MTSGIESQPICLEARREDYCHGPNNYATERLGQDACAMCLAPAFARALEQLDRDSLTNLYNIKAFNGLINERMKTQETFALIFVDLENFGAVNDREQHIGGNFILRRTAEFLSDTLREDDIARFGGDEFCIALSGGREGELTQEDVDLVIDKISRGFHELEEVKKYNKRYEDQRLGLHIGSAIWEPGTNVESLYRAADPEKVKTHRATRMFARIKGWLKFLTNSSNV